jgi:zinc/manganese transport system ATP-binding protein
MNARSKPSAEETPALKVPSVSLKNASATLGGRTIWENVTLDIPQGEFVAVIGPNGAGKSTLLKAIVGLIPLSSGTITVFGQPVHRGNSNIAYLPQRRSFDNDIRIRGRDIVRLGIDGTRWGISLPGLGGSSRDANRRVDEVLELVGARGYADRPISDCSGGEQQRLLIAQALVARPRMLLLDEPLDSLDLSNQQTVADLIDEICREQGVTILLVAHDVNTTMPYLDRLIYIAGGRTLSGRPEEVITSERLTDLYGTPIEVLRTSSGRLIVVGHPESFTYHHH